MNRGFGSVMSLPETGVPACPKHETYMIREAVDSKTGLSLIQGKIPGFRCPSPECSIVYVTGNALEGFYFLEPNGDLTPYLR
jgi:hypothetical protein